MSQRRRFGHQRRAGVASSAVSEAGSTPSAPQWQGDVHPAYDSPRPEVTDLVPMRARRVLDVGCSTGAVTAPLRDRGAQVVGLEADPALAARARTALDDVVESDVEAMAAAGTPVPGGPFDCVVLADVLEHLRDPWAVVRWVDDALLADGGSIVVSVPNVAHVQTLGALARRRWRHDDVGIFDRTHLRFFARRNLPELVAGTRLSIVETRRNQFVALDHTSRWNRLAPYLGDWGTLQFLFRAER